MSISACSTVTMRSKRPWTMRTGTLMAWRRPRLLCEPLWDWRDEAGRAAHGHADEHRRGDAFVVHHLAGRARLDGVAGLVVDLGPGLAVVDHVHHQAAEMLCELADDLVPTQPGAAAGPVGMEE